MAAILPECWFAPKYRRHAREFDLNFPIRVSPCHFVTKMRRNEEIKSFFFRQKSGTSQGIRR